MATAFENIEDTMVCAENDSAPVSTLVYKRGDRGYPTAIAEAAMITVGNKDYMTARANRENGNVIVKVDSFVVGEKHKDYAVCTSPREWRLAIAKAMKAATLGEICL